MIKIKTKDCKIEILPGCKFTYKEKDYRCIDTFGKGLHCTDCAFSKILTLEECNGLKCEKDERTDGKKVIFRTIGSKNI